MIYRSRGIFPHKARCSRGRRPRPCWISVKTIYWSWDFRERFFLFDPSLTCDMSATLMQGHWLRRRHDIKRHMSGGREFQRKCHRQLPPHLTRHETLHAPWLDECWAKLADSGPTLSWHFVEILMNIQYLNHPPYPNRWMITLIQQCLGLRALLSGKWRMGDWRRLLSDQFVLVPGWCETWIQITVMGLRPL